MNHKTFNKQVKTLLCGLGMYLIANGAHADTVPMPVSSSVPVGETMMSDACLLSFYPEEFVNITLERNNVPKDQWVQINKELAAKDVIGQVEAKAARMTPNPLKDTQQRQAAVPLFRQTLFDNFAEVLRAHGITDNIKIQAMLDDVQAQKAKNVADCIKNHKQMYPANGPGLRPVSGVTQNTVVEGSTGPVLKVTTTAIPVDAQVVPVPVTVQPVLR